LKQSQLPPQKQILRLHRLGRSKSKNYEPGTVCEKLDSDLDQRDHAPIMPRSSNALIAILGIE
jgi:hypothetical protein